jgi:hypothetical protein
MVVKNVLAVFRLSSFLEKKKLAPSSVYSSCIFRYRFRDRRLSDTSYTIKDVYRRKIWIIACYPTCYLV